jgi:uncharacterized protein
MSRSTKFMEATDAYDNNQEELALRIMEECAGLGDPVACFTAAIWHRNGEGVPINLIKSKEFLDRLSSMAEKGHPEAQWQLSTMFRWGAQVALDIEQANYWLEQSAEGGYGEAQHHLAWYYETGQYDYSVDLVESAKWYKLAFDQGHPETLYTVAVGLFCKGQPTEEAIKLLRLASSKGFKQAEHVLKSCTH